MTRFRSFQCPGCMVTIRVRGRELDVFHSCPRRKWRIVFFEEVHSIARAS